MSGFGSRGGDYGRSRGGGFGNDGGNSLEMFVPASGCGKIIGTLICSTATRGPRVNHRRHVWWADRCAFHVLLNLCLQRTRWRLKCYSCTRYMTGNRTDYLHFYVPKIQECILERSRTLYVTYSRVETGFLVLLHCTCTFHNVEVPVTENLILWLVQRCAKKQMPSSWCSETGNSLKCHFLYWECEDQDTKFIHNLCLFSNIMLLFEKNNVKIKLTKCDC